MMWLLGSVLAVSVFGTYGCTELLSNDVVKIGEQGVKHVKLMHFSDEKVAAHEFAVFNAQEQDYSKGITSFQKSPGAVDIGMSGVPVLDQGDDGTCVTFSTTALLDSIIKQGDFVSQQCSLALDLGLGQNFWEGADAPSQVLLPLQKYGVIQQSKCPSVYPDEYASLSGSQAEALSDQSASKIVSALKYQYYQAASIDVVKKSLVAGRRVLMAFMLNDQYQQAVQGFDIIVDGKKYSGGFFACKQQNSPNYCGSSNAGHEIIVIGYDDKQQLLKIRNSWGNPFGDNGDYYMTYKFFSQMAVDLTVIY